MEQHTCRSCKSSGPFHPSYIANHNYLCKPCASKSVKECRLREPSRLMTYRVYNSQRLKKNGKAVSQDFVSNILTQWEFKSVISGEKDVNQLCVVSYFKDLPMSEWNSIVLTRREARRFTHLKTKVYDVFPEVVQEKMDKARRINSIKL
jgi:hypothetical protein